MWLHRLSQVLNWELELGSLRFSILGGIQLLILVLIVFLAASIVRRLFLLRILSRTGISHALQGVLARFAGYMVIIIGLFVSLQIMGIQLGNLAFLAGALGLGLGFGLQNIISNFVSGLIILIERPIQVGDRIEVSGLAGTLEGDVVEINARSTKVVTNNNITIIVPNSEFIASRVINWSHGDLKVRIPIPIAVAYGSDPRLVERALLEVAAETPDALKTPPPGARFMSFGNSALNFELRVWTETQVQHRFRLISDVNFRIFEKFQKYGIEIPFPQQDVHIKSMVQPGPLTPVSAQVAATAHLRGNRLFEALGDDEIAWLAEKGGARKFYLRQKIIKQGDPGDSLFVILHGVAGVEVRMPDGERPTRLATLGRGDFFGEMSMLTGEPRHATITAESTTEVFEIHKDHLQPLLSKNPSLVEKLSHALAEHAGHVPTQTAPGSQPSQAATTHAHLVHGILDRVRSFFKLSH